MLTAPDRRRSAGAAGHRRGHAFEDALDDLHARYRTGGRAWVVKVPAPYRVLGEPKGGFFRGVFEGGGPPDYVGVAAGRSYVFDAKQTSEDRWRFGALADHQAEHLDAAQRQGACAFILLWLGGVVWVVPWQALGPLWWAWRREARAAPGTASLSAVDLEAIAHRCQGCDWLPVVAKLLGAR